MEEQLEFLRLVAARLHAAWFVKADFIARKDSAYRKLESDRRRWLDVAGTSIAFVSPEDLIR